MTPWAACATVAGLFLYLALRHGRETIPMPLQLPLWIAATVPNLYLTGFALWHWKYRYRGSHPVAWAAAFPLFWIYAPALIYFARHIDPDRKGRRPYGDGAVASDRPAAPGRFQTMRQVFHVVGFALLAWSIFCAIIATMAHWAIFDVFDEAVTGHVGKVLTAGEVQALHVSHLINRNLVLLLCSAAFAGALGGTLLSLSHSIRWRQREQEERKAGP